MSCFLVYSVYDTIYSIYIYTVYISHTDGQDLVCICGKFVSYAPFLLGANEALEGGRWTMR